MHVCYTWFTNCNLYVRELTNDYQKTYITGDAPK